MADIYLGRSFFYYLFNHGLDVALSGIIPTFSPAFDRLCSYGPIAAIVTSFKARRPHHPTKLLKVAALVNVMVILPSKESLPPPRCSGFTALYATGISISPPSSLSFPKYLLAVCAGQEKTRPLSVRVRVWSSESLLDF